MTRPSNRRLISAAVSARRPPWRACGAAGKCAAGGFYTDASGHQQAFVVSETGP
jgi:hypothetical protein